LGETSGGVIPGEGETSGTSGVGGVSGLGETSGGVTPGEGEASGEGVGAWANQSLGEEEIIFWEK